jgi:hypothetical protein
VRMRACLVLNHSPVDDFVQAAAKNPRSFLGGSRVVCCAA